MRAVCAIVASLVLAGTTFADTINVPGDQPTIAAAISASVNGDVIAIAAGVYYEANLNPGGKAITIQGTVNTNGTMAITIDDLLLDFEDWNEGSRPSYLACLT
ncbi:MAG: hypothetical protein VX527_07465 [Planctomycetota bacterium]|nr:hypothetical protein [Planctomycetota bacterium]